MIRAGLNIQISPPESLSSRMQLQGALDAPQLLRSSFQLFNEQRIKLGCRIRFCRPNKNINPFNSKTNTPQSYEISYKLLFKWQSSQHLLINICLSCSYLKLKLQICTKCSKTAYKNISFTNNHCMSLHLLKNPSLHQLTFLVY